MANEKTPPLAAADLEILSPDINYLVGVSGGRDSIVLLHWLVEHQFKNLVVCHFNHSLRGEDSEGDEKFVRQVAADLDLEYISVKNDSRIFAQKSKQSLETAARESRYRFFAKIAKEKSCQRLLLAHHADDQVETVLMNLFRGAGLKGLGGMQRVSHREIDSIPLEIIRPLLKVTRDEIDTYRKDKNLSFREDSTNKELFAVRNRVRHELLPLAEEIFQRDSTASILRLAEIAEMEHSSAQMRAGRWLSRYQQPMGGLPLRELRQLSPSELNHVLHLWLKHQQVKDCGFKEVQMIAAMARSSGKPAKVNLPGNLFARRRSGVLFVTSEV